MTVDEALAELGRMGLIVDDFIVDGQVHRTAIEGKRASNKAGAYCLRELLLRSGRSVLIGFAQNHVSGELRAFSVSDGEVDRDELADVKKQQAAMKKQAEIERKQRADHAAKRAQEIWDKLPESGKAPYLFNKGVRGYGLRYARDSVVVPLRDVEGNWRGLQFIKPDGSKRFLTGTAKKGAMHIIGEINKGVAIAEGYATAATVHEAMGWPVAVAFDAGNLLDVAQALKAKFPDLRIIICGDDDVDTPGNPGRTKAIAAAKAVGGRAVFPQKVSNDN